MSSVKCPSCGLVNWSTAEICKRCDYSFVDPGQAGGGQAGMAANDGFAHDGFAHDGFAHDGFAHDAPAHDGFAHDAPAHDGFAHDGFSHEAGSSGYSEGGYRQESYRQDSYRQDGYRQGTYQGPRMPYALPEGPKSSGLAIASLVLGIVSLFVCGGLGIGPVVALILGIVAVKRARNYPTQYGGEGIAIAGIVMGAVSTVAFTAIVFAIAIPNLLASRRAANEGAAISSLRTITAAEATYAATVGRGNYGTLQELAAANLIDAQLGSSKKSGYSFDIRADGRSYQALATPNDGDRDARSFYSSEDGVIRGSKKGGMPATAYDPPLGGPNNPFGSSDSDSRQTYSPPPQPRYSPSY